MGIVVKGYYSLGLTGYEIWATEEDVRDGKLHVLYVGATKEQIARRYKVQDRNVRKFRPFVRPNGRRIYLDEALRVEV